MDCSAAGKVSIPNSTFLIPNSNISERGPIPSGTGPLYAYAYKVLFQQVVES